MGKNPFDELDPDVQALRASMRPTGSAVSWGRVLTGVLVVACVTFGLAYYLPLRRAHETLSARFAELQARVDAAQRTAADASARVKELDQSKQSLEKQLEETKQIEKTRAEASRAVLTALEPKLQKPLSSGQAALGSVDGRSTAALSLGYVLSRGKLEVSPQGKLALCSAAAASNKRSIRVVAIADKKDVPAALATKLKTSLQHNLAVAEIVAQTLLDKCGVNPASLSVTAAPSAPASPAISEGKKLAGPRVELWLESMP
jgi:hypothetical protein